MKMSAVFLQSTNVKKIFQTVFCVEYLRIVSHSVNSVEYGEDFLSGSWYEMNSQQRDKFSLK